MKDRFDGYLCSAYSHPDPTVRHARFRTACRVVGWAMQRGLYLYSPVVHSHLVCEYCNLPLHFEFWQEMDHVGIRSCEAFYMLNADGLEKSRGAIRELFIAYDFGKMFYFVEPKGDAFITYTTNVPSILGTNHVQEVKRRNPDTIRIARSFAKSIGGCTP